jgi:hypothetical protein
MENQVPPSQAPSDLQGLEGQITPEQLNELKARARQVALQQAIAQQAAFTAKQPSVVYVRRNLTVAEVLLIVLLACGIVTGVQWSWNALANLIPRIEVKVN